MLKPSGKGQAMTVDTVDTGKLWDVIGDIRLGMLTLRGQDGRLHSSPMTTQNRASDRGGVLWFFMSRSGERIRDLLAEPEVNVAYADPDADRYVSISGVARVIEDPVKKAELFDMAAKAWFAGGASDPNLALVAVVVNEAEYWDVKSNKAVQLFKLAKAAVTGEKPRDLGEHRRVRLH
jgi:general stress protein 26